MILRYLISCLFLTTLVLSFVQRDEKVIEQIQDALDDIIAKSDYEPLNFNDYPKEIWPHLEAFRHVNMFEQNPKVVHNPWDEHDIGDGILCNTCDAFIGRVIAFLRNGTDIEAIEAEVARLCIALNIETEEVCNGIVEVFGPTMEYIIMEQLGDRAVPQLFCGLMLNEECLTPELYDEVNGWTLDIPSGRPPYSPPPLPIPGSPEIKVLEFTDVHIDLTYLTGSNVDCGSPCCCLGSYGLAAANETQAGYWGTYGGCDMPLRTLEEMFRQISTQFPGQISYGYYIGDSPAHDVWAQTKQSNMNHNAEVIGLFRQYFPGVKLFYTFGNHEGYPVNVFPTRYITDPEFNGAWLYNGGADLLQGYLDPIAEVTFRENGRYAMRPTSGLKIINLNNNFGVGQNLDTYGNFVDPEGQLQWLIGELADSESLNEKVHILTHHPQQSVLDGYAREFSRIVYRYENTIAAIFTGHTHSDEARVYMNENGEASVVTYVNPSFTSRHNKQPEFRVFTFDGGYSGASWQVLDIETYSADVEASNDPNVPPQFSLLYSAKQTYGMTQLLGRDWINVYQSALTDDATLQNIVRFEEQNHSWTNQVPSNKTSYLCKKLYYPNKSDPCIFQE